MRVGPYLNMELWLPREYDYRIQNSIVKQRAVDVEGIPIVFANDNPLIDSIQYEV